MEKLTLTRYIIMGLAALALVLTLTSYVEAAKKKNGSEYHKVLYPIAPKVNLAHEYKNGKLVGLRIENHSNAHLKAHMFGVHEYVGKGHDHRIRHPETNRYHVVVEPTTERTDIQPLWTRGHHRIFYVELHEKPQTLETPHTR